VSHVPARRAISPRANSLSLRALAGCHRSQLAVWPIRVRGRGPVSEQRVMRQLGHAIHFQERRFGTKDTLSQCLAGVGMGIACANSIA